MARFGALILISATIPFGASKADFDAIDRQPRANRHFDAKDGRIHCVSTGRGGDDLATALDTTHGDAAGGVLGFAEMQVLG